VDEFIYQVPIKETVNVQFTLRNETELDHPEKEQKHDDFLQIPGVIFKAPILKKKTYYVM
jgi:hypothetical protein